MFFPYFSPTSFKYIFLTLFSCPFSFNSRWKLSAAIHIYNKVVLEPIWFSVHPFILNVSSFALASVWKWLCIWRDRWIHTDFKMNSILNPVCIVRMLNWATEKKKTKKKLSDLVRNLFVPFELCFYQFLFRTHSLTHSCAEFCWKDEKRSRNTNRWRAKGFHPTH